MDISHETLSLILHSNHLSIKEWILFQRCYEWAESKVKLGLTCRDVLGDAVYTHCWKIHFPTMGIERFKTRVVSKNILTQNEQSEIYELMKLSRNKLDESTHKRFSCERRIPGNIFKL